MSHDNMISTTRYATSDGTIEKVYVSAFQNFFQIENSLNIKDVMNKNIF